MATREPKTILILSVLALAALICAAASLSWFRTRAADAEAQRDIAALSDEVTRLKNPPAPEAQRAEGAPAVVAVPAGDVVTKNESGVEAAPAQNGPTDVQFKEFVASKFHGENIDASWSRAAEQLASNAISQHLPQGASLRSVTCRKTLCEIATLHPDMESYGKFMEATFAGGESALWNGAMMAGAVEDTGAGIEAITYFSREGDPMPVMDAPLR